MRTRKVKKRVGVGGLMEVGAWGGAVPGSLRVWGWTRGQGIRVGLRVTEEGSKGRKSSHCLSLS